MARGGEANFANSPPEKIRLRNESADPVLDRPDNSRQNLT